MNIKTIIVLILFAFVNFLAAFP